VDDVELLVKAVEANPRDVGARLALTDAISERDTDAPALPLEVLAAAYLRGYTVAEVRRMLDAANGRRRTRTLDLDDVVRCARAALRDADGWYATGGGVVANAYKYPAEQTACVVVVRSDGLVRLAIGTTGAKKGNSLTNWATGLSIKGKPEAFRKWADAGQG
jgi:hypothetical protein